MSVPVTIDLPETCQPVSWRGRMGPVRAVAGVPPHPRGRVLLLPGFTGSKEDYFALLGLLCEQGWAVAAADLPGMYESAGSLDASDYRLELLVQDVREMVRIWGDGEQVHLIGHSVGGLVARHAACADPPAFASLTLYASGCGSLVEEARVKTQLLLAALEHRTPGEVHRLKLDLDQASGRELPPPSIEAFLERRWEGTSIGHLRGMAEIASSAPDLVAELAELSGSGSLPLLVLYGEHDNSTWDQQSFAELARRTATATVVIPGADHSPAVENPAAMASALVDFWSSLR